MQPNFLWHIVVDEHNRPISSESVDPNTFPQEQIEDIHLGPNQQLAEQGIILYYDQSGNIIGQYAAPAENIPPLRELEELDQLPGLAALTDEEAGNLVNPNSTPATIQAERHERERLERTTGRALTEQEKELVALRHIDPNRLSDLDKKTLAITDRYTHLINPNKLVKAGKVIGRVLVTAGAGALIRGALHTVMPFGAGAIAGGFVGGIVGYLRARSAEKDRLHSTQAVIHEYNALKNEQRDPQRQRNALAFLQSFLEEGRFKGNLSELLDIMAFYKKEASGFYEGRRVDEQILKTLSENGKGFVLGFERQAAQAIDSKKLRKAAGRGALIGAGLGLASDLIGAWVGHVRSEHAREAFIQNHAGPDHQINLSNEQPPTTAESMTYDPQHLEKVAQGLNSDPTDFGNALSHAVKTGFDSAHQSLQLPAELAKMPISEQQTMLQQFIHDLNYSHPSTDNAFVGYHNDYNFNNGALQMLLDKAFHGASYGADGVHIDPHSYLGAIVNADQILTNEFAANLAHGAAEAGREAATQGLAENLIHGAAIGGLTGLKIEQESKRHEESLVGGGGDGGGNGPAAPNADAQTPEQAAAAQAAAEAAAVTPPATPETPPEETEIDWNALKDDEPKFKATAKKVIDKLGEVGLSGLNDEFEKKNLDSLLKFAEEKGYDMTFKKGDTELGQLVSYDVTEDKKTLKVKLQNDEESIDLKDESTTSGLKLVEIEKRPGRANDNRDARARQRRQGRNRRGNA